MTTKHTPGPWRVEDHTLKADGTGVNPNLPRRLCIHCGKLASFSDGTPAYEPVTIAINAKGWGVAQIGTLEPVAEHDQHMANARLIAAAPDLLAALHALMMAFGGVTTNEQQKHWDAARAAIAKAIGDTP